MKLSESLARRRYDVSRRCGVLIGVSAGTSAGEWGALYPVPKKPPKAKNSPN